MLDLSAPSKSLGSCICALDFAPETLDINSRVDGISSYLICYIVQFRIRANSHPFLLIDNFDPAPNDTTKHRTISSFLLTHIYF